MDLSEYRKEIDTIDDELIAIFEKRLAVSGKIARFKFENGIPVYDAGRESQKLESVKETVLKNGGTIEDAELTAELFDKIMELSKKRQEIYIRGEEKS